MNHDGHIIPTHKVTVWIENTLELSKIISDLEGLEELEEFMILYMLKTALLLKSRAMALIFFVSKILKQLVFDFLKFINLIFFSFFKYLNWTGSVVFFFWYQA